MSVLDDALSPFADTIYQHKYAEEGEVWHDAGPGSKSTPRRVVESVMGQYLPHLVEPMIRLISERKFMPGGRYLYASGKPFHQTQNCLLLKVDDSREGWADLNYRVTSGLMTGAGIGTVYSWLRPLGARVKGMGGTSTGPIALMQIVNETGRGIMQGGSRRAAIWAGLHWWHADVFTFIHMKDWSDVVRAEKEKDYNFPATMDMTNISVILDPEFFAALEDPAWTREYTLGGHTWTVDHEWAHRVYWEVIEQMLKTGEPGFSVDYDRPEECLRNACTEIVSADDNDICNLGSLNLARFDDLEDFTQATHVATAFLLCGTLYSKVPYERVAETRAKNRRLGLGLMGLHEWLLVRGKPYGPDSELAEWLDWWKVTSDSSAQGYSRRLKISRPVAVRAIAPTGTIGILAETTTGMEPVFAVALIRLYLKGLTWFKQYVVDATAKRLIDKGIDPALIEDAYDLAQNPERRVAFQAWLQQWVDHGISSTINLPAFDEQPFTPEEFGTMLLRYLPRLRGITVYPNGSRGGQPLTKVPLQEALDWEGVEIEEAGNSQACISGSCGV